MTRVAAIDCGTNTVKLLVADLNPATGTETEHVREMRMVRLGQGVDRTGRLADDALARTFAALDEYADLIREHDVAAVRFCATSATRDATNADVFARGVEERLGLRPEVVTGAEEAALAYAGATRGRTADLPGPFLVVDIGGGSTELILGTGHGEVTSAHSMDVGSVRLTERHLASDPPTADEIARAVADIDAALDACPVAAEEARTVIGVAGTITTVAAAVLDLPAYQRDAIDQADLDRAEVHAATERLLGLTVAERRDLPYLHPGRADVIGAGALLLDRVLQRTRVARLRVSEADILDGIAWSLA